MVFVKAQPGDTTDSVIRKFTRKVIAEGLLLEFKKKAKIFRAVFTKHGCWRSHTSGTFEATQNQS